MNKAIKRVRGFNDADKPVTKELRNLRLRIWLHKSMTKSELIEAAAIVMNWLESNGLLSATAIKHGINISGFDGDSAELWEDRGSRTFCKMVLEAFAPAICGLVDWKANNLSIKVTHCGMSLLGLAAVALGEDFGWSPTVAHEPKECFFPVREVGLRIVECVKRCAPSVNSRADQLAAGAPPSPHPLFSAFCEGASGQTVYMAPGMKSAVGRIGKAVLKDLVEAGQIVWVNGAGIMVDEKEAI